MTEPDRWHTIVTTVENKPGVLARVAGLFSRRGFNIESLAVAATDDELLEVTPGHLRLRKRILPANLRKRG